MSRRSGQSKADTGSCVLCHRSEDNDTLASTSKDAFATPDTHRLYQPRAGEGPRARRQREEMLRQAQEEMQQEKEQLEEELSRVDYVTATQQSFYSEPSFASLADTQSVEPIDVEQLVHEPAITFYSYNADSSAVHERPFYRSRKFTANGEEEELWH